MGERGAFYSYITYEGTKGISAPPGLLTACLLSELLLTVNLGSIKSCWLKDHSDASFALIPVYVTHTPTLVVYAGIYKLSEHIHKISIVLRASNSMRHWSGLLRPVHRVKTWSCSLLQ